MRVAGQAAPTKVGCSIQETRPAATSSACSAQSNTIIGTPALATCHVAVPVAVHGQCQLVRVVTSGLTSLRPAAHISVKSWQRPQ